MIQILLWLPLAAGLVCFVVPRRAVPLDRPAWDPRHARALHRRRRRLQQRHRRAPADGQRQLDPRPRRALPARRRRDQPLPDPAHSADVGGRYGLLDLPHARAAADLLLHARPRRDGRARRLPRSGPAAVRPLLRPDAGAVLVPDRGLRRREPDRRDDEDDRLHARRLAADARSGDRDRRACLGRRRPHQLLARRPASQHAVERQPVLDLLLLRARLPDQDAGLPRPRLDARRLPRGAAARAGAALRRALEGRRLRLPARRPAALPQRDDPLPGGDPGDRRRRDHLRLDHGVHADERAADRRLLLPRAARLHHDRDLLPAPRRGRRVRPADGQPRPRRGSDLPHRRAAVGALRERGPHAARGTRDARPCARRAVPDHHPGQPGDAGHRQLHGRVLHPDRRLPVEDRLRLRGVDRHRPRRLLLDPPVPANDAQPADRERRLARDRPARRAGARAARGLHRCARALSGPDPRACGYVGEGTIARPAPRVNDRCPGTPVERSPPLSASANHRGWTGYAPINEVSN